MRARARMRQPGRGAPVRSRSLGLIRTTTISSKFVVRGGFDSACEGSGVPCDRRVRDCALTLRPASTPSVSRPLSAFRM